jgi:hypothetical protein
MACEPGPDHRAEPTSDSDEDELRQVLERLEAATSHRLQARANASDLHSPANPGQEGSPLFEANAQHLLDTTMHQILHGRD